jgi:hypothetical protein
VSSRSPSTTRSWRSSVRRQEREPIGCRASGRDEIAQRSRPRFVGFREEVRAQIRDIEDRVAGIWETRTPPDAAEETRRMSYEFTKRVVDAYTEAEGKPSGTPPS